MIKNKGKFLATVLFIAIFAFVFAISAFAVEIRFYNGENIDTDVADNGKLEVEEDGEFTFPTKEDVEKNKTLHWYTTDGLIWEAGTTAKLSDCVDTIGDEGVKFYQIQLVDVYTYEELVEYSKGTTRNAYEQDKVPMRLMADISGNGNITTPGADINFIHLNGYTLTITGGDRAFGNGRSGSSFYGAGTVKYDGAVFHNTSRHTYNHWGIVLFVGKNVVIDAPNATLFRCTGTDNSASYPKINIYGSVKVKSILEMTDGPDISPSINVYDGAFVELSGKTVINTGNNIKINIKGGTIYSNSVDYSFFYEASKNTYNITGGSFVLEYDGDVNTLKKTINIASYSVFNKTLNSKFFYSVVPASCAHNFTLRERPNEENLACIDGLYERWACAKCGTSIIYSFETPSFKHEFKELGSKNPSETEPGWKKSICTNGCYSVHYEIVPFDPSFLTVEVVIELIEIAEDGTITVKGEKIETPLVKDFFKMTDGTLGFIIRDLLPLANYEEGTYQVKEINIPAGVAGIQFVNEISSIKVINLKTGGNVVVTDLKNFTALETIRIYNTEVEFKSNCAPDTLTSIETMEKGGKITFGASAFSGKTSLTNLVLLEETEYIFGTSSFQGTGLTELILGDSLNVTFEKDATSMFKSCASLEKIYIGKKISELPASIFEGCKTLTSVTIMSVTKMGDNAFKSIGANAKVYHHALTLEMGNNTFGNNTDIQLFTLAAVGYINGNPEEGKDPDLRGKGFVGSTYKIHYGIKHEYFEHTTDATCYSTGGTYYTTDCVCGEVKDAIYKIFENQPTVVEEYEIKECIEMIEPMLPHARGECVLIRYDNGYSYFGTAVYKCTNDGCGMSIDENAPTQKPLIKHLGFSVKEYGSYSVATKYELDREAIDRYQEINKTKFELGAVYGVKKTLGENTPLYVSENAGEKSLALNRGAVNVDFTSDDKCVYELTLKGILEENLNMSYIFCMYIADNYNIAYIQETENVKNPSGVSYNEIYAITHMDE